MSPLPRTLPPSHPHPHIITPSHPHIIIPSATYSPSRDETSRCGSNAEAHPSLWGAAIGWRQHPPWSGQLQSLQVSPQSDSNSSIYCLTYSSSFPFKVHSDSNIHNQFIPASSVHSSIFYSSIPSPFLHPVEPVLIASFSRVCKLLIRKLILLIAHPYVQICTDAIIKFAM